MHEVPEATRQASVWHADYAAYRTPDGRWWRYTSDPRGEGVEWRDSNGQSIQVAVWVEGEA